jgi:hypothetical protein
MSQKLNLSFLFIELAQAVGADIDFLLFALKDHFSLADVRHKTSIAGVHRVAARVTVQWTLAANLASLCHE